MRINKIKAVLISLLAVLMSMSSTVQVNAAEPSVIAIVEVKDYSIDGGMLTPGTEVTLNITLANTSATYSASSIMLTMSSDSKMIYPVYGTDNQVYVGTIAPGASKTVAIPVSVSSYFKGEAVDVRCRIDFISNDIRLSNESTLIIPASGGNMVGVKSVDVANHAVVGGRSLISMKYINQSNQNIKDATLVIDGNISPQYREIAMDTIYSNKEYLDDFYVCFTEPGPQSINIAIRYTGADGDVFTEDLGTYSVTVSKAIVNDDSELVSAKILKLIGLGVMGLAGLVIIIMIIVYGRKRL